MGADTVHSTHLYCMSLVPIYLCARICLLFIVPISDEYLRISHRCPARNFTKRKSEQHWLANKSFFSSEKGKMFAKKINAGCKRQWNDENRVFVYEHFVENGNRFFCEMNRRVLSDKKITKQTAAAVVEEQRYRQQQYNRLKCHEICQFIWYFYSPIPSSCISCCLFSFNFFFLSAFVFAPIFDHRVISLFSPIPSISQFLVVFLLKSQLLFQVT